MTDIDDDDKIEKLLTVHSDGGLPVVRVGLLATLYFGDSGSKAVRERVLDCLERYVGMCQDRLRWKRHPQTLRFRRINEKDVPTPREWLASLSQEDEWEFSYHGGEHADAADDCMLGAYGPRPAEGGLGFLSMSFPLSWFTDHDGTFPGYIESVCRRLRPWHGYAGPGLVESQNRAIRREYEPTVYEIAQRFPGIEVDYPAKHSVYLEEGIKGGNWLTVLGDAWITRLGGLAKLRAAGVSDLIEYPGGVILQTGNKPQFGDREKGRVPEKYRKLAKVLEPIRVRVHGAFQQASPLPHFDKRESMRWLARFDAL